MIIYLYSGFIWHAEFLMKNKLFESMSRGNACKNKKTLVLAVKQGREHKSFVVPP